MCNGNTTLPHPNRHSRPASGGAVEPVLALLGQGAVVLHPRVLVLGDSLAFGLGVAEEEPLPASLQQQLQARLPCRKVVVLNAGLPGANLFQNVQRLAPALQRFAPDLVVLALLVTS